MISQFGLLLLGFQEPKGLEASVRNVVNVLNLPKFDGSWQKVTKSSVTVFTKGSLSIGFDTNTMLLKHYLDIRPPGKLARKRLLSKQQSLDIAEKYRKALGLPGSRTKTTLEPSTEKSRKRSYDIFEGCYGFVFSEEPYGIDAFTNGNSSDFVVDGETGRIVAIEQRTGIKYFGKPPKAISQKLRTLQTEMLKKKSQRQIGNVKFQHVWITSGTLPSYASKFEGIDKTRDCILVDYAVIDRTRYYFEPGTSNVIGSIRY